MERRSMIPGVIAVVVIFLILAAWHPFGNSNGCTTSDDGGSCTSIPYGGGQ